MAYLLKNGLFSFKCNLFNSIKIKAIRNKRIFLATEKNLNNTQVPL